MIVLEIHGWHTQCGACGYGRGGWASSPARDGKKPLSPSSRVCHGCGETFTHTLAAYSESFGQDPQPEAIEPESEAA